MYNETVASDHTCPSAPMTKGSRIPPPPALRFTPVFSVPISALLSLPPIPPGACPRAAALPTHWRAPASPSPLLLLDVTEHLRANGLLGPGLSPSPPPRPSPHPRVPFNTFKVLVVRFTGGVWGWRRTGPDSTRAPVREEWGWAGEMVQPIAPLDRRCRRRGLRRPRRAAAGLRGPVLRRLPLQPPRRCGCGTAGGRASNAWFASIREPICSTPRSPSNRWVPPSPQGPPPCGSGPTSPASRPPPPPTRPPLGPPPWTAT